MRRKGEALVIAVTLVLLFFYLAPLLYWGTAYATNTLTGQSLGTGEEYRSLSCMTVGLGFTYWAGASWTTVYGGGPRAFGLQLGCSGPFPK